MERALSEGRGARIDHVAVAWDVPGLPSPMSDDAPMYNLIELMFFAYRDFVRDADRILEGDGFGRAHHRVLYFVTRRPGLTIAELLDILGITKQSLNRVLNDLIERSYVSIRSGEADRRRRLLHATPRGEALILRIAEAQSARFARAFATLGEDARPAAAGFLEAMIGGGEARPACDGALARTNGEDTADVRMRLEARIRTVDARARTRHAGSTS